MEGSRWRRAPSGLRRSNRAVESNHLYLLVDLDRCELIDVVAVKLLVVAHALLSAQGTEMLIFGATDRVRGAIEAVEAFDGRVLR
jgi:anti-anti-sigma regulatory factor